jgi:hypothetical protein
MNILCDLCGSKHRACCAALCLYYGASRIIKFPPLCGIVLESTKNVFIALAHPHISACSDEKCSIPEMEHS